MLGDTRDSWYIPALAGLTLTCTLDWGVDIWGAVGTAPLLLSSAILGRHGRERRTARISTIHRVRVRG